MQAIVFQALDAAGKDGAIKHVMSGVNPQSVEVTSFKEPSSEDLDHTFLWRCMKKLPERGRIGIFNRSYYEEVLIVRVHPELLEAQRIPNVHAEDRTWLDRFNDINAFIHSLSPVVEGRCIMRANILNINNPHICIFSNCLCYF